jgi:hypothetical protein
MKEDFSRGLLYVFVVGPVFWGIYIHIYIYVSMD